MASNAIRPGDERYETIAISHRANNEVPIFTMSKSVYRAVNDNGVVSFFLLPKNTAKSSFGTLTPGWYGYYPPDPPKDPAK